MTEKAKPTIYWHVHPLGKASMPEDFLLGQEYSSNDERYGFVNSHNQFHRLLTQVDKSPNQILAVLPDTNNCKDNYRNYGFGVDKIDGLVEALQKSGRLIYTGVFPGVDDVENLQERARSLLEAELIDCDHIVTGISGPNCGSRTATMIKDGIVYSRDNKSLVLTDQPIARPKRIFWDPKYTTTNSPDGIVFISSGLREGTHTPYISNSFMPENRVKRVQTVAE